MGGVKDHSRRLRQYDGAACNYPSSLEGRKVVGLICGEPHYYVSLPGQLEPEPQNIDSMSLEEVPQLMDVLGLLDIPI